MQTLRDPQAEAGHFPAALGTNFNTHPHTTAVGNMDRSVLGIDPRVWSVGMNVLQTVKVEVEGL